MGKKFLTALIVATLALAGCRGAPTGPEQMDGCEGTLSAPSYNGTAYVTMEDCE